MKKDIIGDSFHPFSPWHQPYPMGFGRKKNDIVTFINSINIYYRLLLYFTEGKFNKGISINLIKITIKNKW